MVGTLGRHRQLLLSVRVGVEYMFFLRDLRRKTHLLLQVVSGMRRVVDAFCFPGDQARRCCSLGGMGFVEVDDLLPTRFQDLLIIDRIDPY
jgi:hypothetical protein